jgi:signal transduction histidine kinase
MRSLIRVLAIGFAAVIVLLAAAAATTSLYTARSIAAGAALVRDQLVIVRLLDGVEREQNVLNAAFYRLSDQSSELDRADVQADLDQTDDEIRRLVENARGGEDEAEWNNLQQAMLDFSQAARALLTQKDVPPSASRDLFARHEEVTRSVARLVSLSYEHAVETRENLDRQSKEAASESKFLLGGCIVVALVCAIFTVRIAARVFRKMESQEGELSRVSFRLLESQESTARRFAHELHDELGGSLTAIRSNLAAMLQRPDPARIEDSMKLVDDSISNVRELSQLLRPTILDDFGLDAGIHWLATRFRERTGIELDYKSEFNERLNDETETHLFRIVQEALTNIARHSEAARATIRLNAQGDRVHLTIADNGKGMGPARPGSMGLSGMRARARSAGGDLEIRSVPGHGVTIDVSAPRLNHATQPATKPTGELV